MGDRVVFNNVTTISLFITTVGVVGAVAVTVCRHAQRVNIVGILNYRLNDVHAVFLLRDSAVKFVNKLVNMTFDLLTDFILGGLSAVLTTFNRNNKLSLSNLVNNKCCCVSKNNDTTVSVVPP